VFQTCVKIRVSFYLLSLRTLPLDSKCFETITPQRAKPSVPSRKNNAEKLEDKLEDNNMHRRGVKEELTEELKEELKEELTRRANKKS
jgi:hypothetical protein